MKAGSAIATFAVFILVLLISSAEASAAAPANDDFAAATALPAVLPPGEQGTNLDATKEVGEPDHAENAGGHSVWYSWTPSTTSWVGIQKTSCFSGIDAMVAVYTGPLVTALTPVASNASPAPPTCYFSEIPQAEFEATAGTTYWIAVDGRDGAQGTFELQFNLPPANDDFADASTIPAQAPAQGPFSSTRLSSKEGGEPDHAGNPGGHSVWFAWTPDATGPVAISTCASFGGLDPVLAVYTGSALGDLTPVAANDDAPSDCTWVDSAVTFDAVSGTTYRIAVDGADGTLGRFNLRVRRRPQNDDFANAQTIALGVPPSLSQVSNQFATEEAGEPDHAGTTGGRSLWYSWTPSSSGPMAISTCTYDGLDTLLAVYTGSSIDALTPVASGDDHGQGGCSEPDSEVRFSAAAGVTYLIAVDGKSGSEGKFDLHLDAPPANDDFANAKALGSALPSYDFGFTKFGSVQAGEPSHAGVQGGDSVWYSWTPSSSGPVAISVCPYGERGPDTLLGVYTGSAVGELTPVAANDDSPAACQDTGSEVEIDALAGTTYRIAVDDKNGIEGMFSLELNGRPANDDFGASSVLPAYALTAGGSTTFAGKQSGEPDHAGNAGGHSVWYSWTATTSGPLDIVACGYGPGVDTLLAVYTGSELGDLTPVVSNDDVPAKSPLQQCELPTDSELVLDAVAGTTYRIALDTKNGEGRYFLGFQFGPGNDDFAKATVLAGSEPLYAAPATKLASRESGEPDHAGDTGGHSVWYSWTPSSTHLVDISTCTHYGDMDALLAVYTGSGVGALTPVASDDDGSTAQGCRPTDSEIQFTALAGTTYRIAVDGKGGSSGGLQLILEGVAANDDLIKAQRLGATLPTQGFSSNRFATKQPGEPAHAGDAGGASVWFKWTAPRSGEVSVDTCDSGFDTLLAVYSGATIGTLAPVMSNDDGGGKCGPQSKLSFPAVANTVYRIVVDGKGGNQGPIHLYLDERPQNDEFDKPQLIRGTTGWWVPGSTLLATEQSGEPAHGGDPGTHSVWYSWTPSKSAAVEIDICTRSFDPLVAVYSGVTLDAIAAVPTTEAGAGECDEGRSIGFEAHSDTVYRIAVDAAAADAGHFELRLRPVAPILHALSISTEGAGAGSVSSSRSGIVCGPSCSHDFQEGTALSLVATPADGSTFSGWSGGGCSGTGQCQVRLRSDVSVVATFVSLPSGALPGGGTPPSAPPAISVSPPPTAAPKKPLRCRRGFKKRSVHGKQRCVRKPGKHRRHR